MPLREDLQDTDEYTQDLAGQNENEIEQDDEAIIYDEDFEGDEIEGEIDDDDSDSDSAQKKSDPKNKKRDVVQHPKPKYTYAMLSVRNLADLRKLAKEIGINVPVSMRKDDLIISILKAQAESMNYRFGGGTLEILPENFGFLRPKGMLPTDNDVYLSSSQIRRFGLRNGDVI